MEETREDVAARIDRLSQHVEDLQARVEALESRRVEAAQVVQSESVRPVSVAGVPEGEVVLEGAESLVPLFGWAVLGVAGAYLLRGLTESGVMPGWMGVSLAVLYAGWWLYFAARRGGDKPLYGAIHGLTGTLILLPMLYETAIRFKYISVEAASAILICFAIFGLAIGWRRSITPLVWIVTLGSLVAATVIFRDSHNAVLWCGTILAVAIGVEFSACRDHWLSLRWMVAMAADISVLLLTVLATWRADSTQATTVPPVGMVLAMQIALLTIYLSSTVDRTILRVLKITWFEVGQACVAFLIFFGGALRLAGTTKAGSVSVGMFCLVAGVACYMVSFASLERKRNLDRNFYTYSTFALLLVTVGCWVLLTGAWLTAAWVLLAVGALAAGLLWGRRALRIHSLAYLLAGVVGANLVPIATDRVFHQTQGALNMPPGYLVLMAGLLACYFLLLRFGQRRTSHWAASITGVAVAAMLCWGAAGMAAGWITGLSQSAPLRTALVTAMAIAAGWGGRRWGRPEWQWMAYPLMLLAGFKLIAEDFQEERSIMLFASLIFYGGGLILLHRLLHPRMTAASALR